MATPFPALLRSRGRPSPLHRSGGKGSALPTDPTERGGPPPLLGLSPGLCGPGGAVACFTHRTVCYSISPPTALPPHAVAGPTFLRPEARRGGGLATSGRNRNQRWRFMPGGTLLLVRIRAVSGGRTEHLAESCHGSVLALASSLNVSVQRSAISRQPRNGRPTGFVPSAPVCQLKLNADC